MQSLSPIVWLSQMRLAGFMLLALLALAFSTTSIAADPDAELKQAIGGASTETMDKARHSGNFSESRFDSNYNLINASGETWRQIRNRWVSIGGLIAIGGVLAVLTIFYLIVGQRKLDEPRSGRKILRWTAFERALHWTVAALFIILALSGLLILFGKFLFPNIVSAAFWGEMMTVTKLIHNYSGPLFGILLIIMLAKWVKINLPKKHDWQWIKQGGGLVGNNHPDSGFTNAGEKGWFWLLAFAGLLVISSGLVLDFPNFEQSRDTMQWANIVHAVLSLLLIAASFGHIYIGTLGTEGAAEGMLSGYVDETWAKQHHNLWYEEISQDASQTPPDKPTDDEAATAHRPS